MAEATIRVSPVVPASLAGEQSQFSSNADYRDFVQEQVFEIDNFATASAALDLLGPKRSLWQLPDESDRHAAERLVKALKVEPVADSYLVRIALEGGNPEGLDEIVNAVVKAYLSRTAKRELDGTDVGIQLLTSRQSELQKNIANDQQQLAGLTQELGVSSVSGELINPYDKMVADTNAAAGSRPTKRAAGSSSPCRSQVASRANQGRGRRSEGRTDGCQRIGDRYRPPETD